ncbi:MAG: DUF3301 domain-containing protein [Gammaproteobacteria bacterium]|nr:DUF3301 domain-containing protein [Gammaproteobacteria bacterium]
MENLLIIILITAGIWYWWDTQRCNEMAFSVCKQKCEQAGLQLLDATVSRQRSWLRRGNNGSVQICRLYGFEYCDDQSLDFGQRYSGYIVIIGKQVVETNLPHDAGKVRYIH